MDVPSADDDEPNAEVPDFVPDDLDLACGLCQHGRQAKYDPVSRRILCPDCTWQLPLIFKSRNDPSKT